jgi:hypothetical protein
MRIVRRGRLGTTFSGTVSERARAEDVLAGATPALGDSNFTLEFTNSAPALPIADFEQLLFGPLPGQTLLSVTFNETATGFFADGTPG